MRGCQFFVIFCGLRGHDVRHCASHFATEKNMKHGCVLGLGCGCGCGCGTRQFLKKVGAGAAGLGD